MICPRCGKKISGKKCTCGFDFAKNNISFLGKDVENVIPVELSEISECNREAALEDKPFINSEKDGKHIDEKKKKVELHTSKENCMKTPIIVIGITITLAFFIFTIWNNWIIHKNVDSSGSQSQVNKDTVTATGESNSLLEDQKKRENKQGYKVFATGQSQEGELLQVENWDDIISIYGLEYHTVGLKSDGTVVAAGRNLENQCNVDTWKNVISVAGYLQTMGLKSDGSVLKTSNKTDSSYEDAYKVKSINKVVQIESSFYIDACLKNDGTVWVEDWIYSPQLDVASWKDIISIDCGTYHLVGLKSDGTVVATGFNDKGQCDVESWDGISSIYCGSDYTIGLKHDGTVVACGIDNSWKSDIDSWNNIVAFSSGYSPNGQHLVGLKSDGTVVAIGSNDYGQCDVGNWKDIVAISCGKCHTVGLKRDGTVVATGLNDYGQCDVENYHNVKAISCGDFKTYCLYEQE